MIKLLIKIAFILFLGFIIPANSQVYTDFEEKGYPLPRDAGFRAATLVAESKKGSLLANVAYVDENGNPIDWFFDGFILLRINIEYVNGITDKETWEEWLGALFDNEVMRVKRAVNEARNSLGEPLKPIKLMTFIPYTSPDQNNFGDVDGDGVSENFSRLEDRRKAIDWYINEVLSRFEKIHQDNLEWWGFYWTGEGVYEGEDQGSIRAAADAVHDHELKLLWIPYYKAKGIDRWWELGFDVVTMQPGYAWLAPINGGLPNEAQLSEAASLSRHYGMGVELEFFGASHPVRRNNAQRYIDHGSMELDGYQDGVLTSNDAHFVRTLAVSKEPAIRRVYEDLYAMIKGTHTARPFHQPLMTPPKITGSQILAKTTPKAVIDGRWNTKPESNFPKLILEGDYTELTFDLGAGRLVGDVRLHFTKNLKDEVAIPEYIQLYASNDKTSPSYFEIASTARVGRRYNYQGGFAILTCEPVFAKKMKLVIKHSSASGPLAIDELLLYPAVQLIWGKYYQSPEAVGDGINLTNGIVGDKSITKWDLGEGRIQIRLNQPHYSQTVGVHFQRQDTQIFQPHATLRTNDGYFVKVTAEVHNDEAWAFLPVNRLIQHLEITVSNVENSIVVDEITIIENKSLSIGQPYFFEPSFHSTIPDQKGIQLTDGKLSKTPGDEASVRWYSIFDWPLRNYAPGNIEIILDLGKIQPMDEIAVQLWDDIPGAQFNEWSIKRPLAITASHSQDGRHWSPRNVFHSEPEIIDLVGHQRTIWMHQLLAGEARFIKLQLTPEGRYLMLGEIQVMHEGENIARDQSYTVYPLPTGEGTLVDNFGKLTNGFLTAESAVSPWDPVADFVELSPSKSTQITLDLTGIQMLAGARAHFISGPSDESGAQFPEILFVQTSLDGSKWISAGKIMDHVVPNKTAEMPSWHSSHITGFMDVIFPPREARYIRYHITPGGNPIWIDELEVIPD
jgi:hypothetical protein